MQASIYKVPTCSVCYSSFNEEAERPRLLFNCGHILCEPCLKTLFTDYSRDRKSNFTCFKCKTVHTVEGLDKDLQEHFPICRKVLEMMRPAAAAYHCHHWERLPERFVCLDIRCTQKADHCLLCQEAVHFDCNHDLTIKKSDWERRVRLAGFQPLAFANLPCGLPGQIQPLYEALLAVLNKAIVASLPSDLDDYRNKTASILAEAEGESINLGHFLRSQFVEAVGVMEGTPTTQLEAAGTIAGLVSRMASWDFCWKNPLLQKVLDACPKLAANQKFIKICVETSSPDTLVSEIVGHLVSDEVRAGQEAELNERMASEAEVQKLVLVARDAYKQLIEAPFKGFIHVLGQAEKETKEQPVEDHKFLFQMIRYHKNPATDAPNSNFFRKKLLTNEPILLTEAAAKAVRAAFKEQLPESNELEEALQLIPSTVLTSEFLGTLHKRLRDPSTVSVRETFAWAEENVPRYQLEIDSFLALRAKLGEEGPNLSAFTKCVHLHQSYLWKKDQWTLLAPSMQRSGEFKALMDRPPVNRVSEAVFWQLIRTCLFSEEDASAREGELSALKSTQNCLEERVKELQGQIAHIEVLLTDLAELKTATVQ